MDASESVSDKPVYDPLADDIDQAERLDQCRNCIQRLLHAEFSTTVAMRVNSRLWPDPIDSKTDTLTFYTSECICRRIKHEEDG